MLLGSPGAVAASRQLQQAPAAQPGAAGRPGGLPAASGPFVAAATAQQLRDILRDSGGEDVVRIGLPATAVLRPCFPLEFGPDQTVEVICNGATLDWTCPSADFVVGENTSVTLSGCHSIYPAARGATMRAFEDTELIRVATGSAVFMDCGSSTLVCSVRFPLQSLPCSAPVRNPWPLQGSATAGVSPTPPSSAPAPQSAFSSCFPAPFCARWSTSAVGGAGRLPADV